MLARARVLASRSLTTAAAPRLLRAAAPRALRAAPRGPLPPPPLQPRRLCSATPDRVAAAPLRFALTQLVECRIGRDEWALGEIVGRHYREPGWPEGEYAPYQVALKTIPPRLVFSPLDDDECVRAVLRFKLGDVIMACLAPDVWARGEVVAHHYREPNWPAGQRAVPYQIRLLDEKADDGTAVLIWAPEDSDACVRALSHFECGHDHAPGTAAAGKGGHDHDHAPGCGHDHSH